MAMNENMARVNSNCPTGYPDVSHFMTASLMVNNMPPAIIRAMARPGALEPWTAVMSGMGKPFVGLDAVYGP